MTRLIFSGPAILQLARPNLLRFMERQYDFVAYEVAGFGVGTLLLDYRQASQGETSLRGNGVNGGEERPFHLEIWEFGPQQVQIELHDTIRAKAPWTLTITPTQGTAVTHRAFFQHPAPTVGGATITLDRRPLAEGRKRRLPAFATPLPA
jgi:hypothetical protein